MTVRPGDTVVLVSTKKGLFVLRSRDRRSWRTAGPYFEGLPLYHATSDGKRVYASVASEHWGATVRRSDSWGARWAKPKGAPQYTRESGLSVDRVWNVALGHNGELYAGVEPAGLFVSRDGGDSWDGIDGFNAQPTRRSWMPGGGGLCLHTILPHPHDERRMVVAASAVGIFETTDAGASWRLMNGGIRADHLPQKKTPEDMLGSCPHKLVRDARDPDQLYMQNHFGVYKRKATDAAWKPIMSGLPSRFGFPMVAHPHEAGTVYTVPLVADHNRVTADGAPAVYRTRDAGKSWQRLDEGFPRSGAYHTILRDALATDGKDPAGLYMGTTTGELYASRDEGDTWTTLTTTLPPILSVSATVAK